MEEYKRGQPRRRAKRFILKALENVMLTSVVIMGVIAIVAAGITLAAMLSTLNVHP